MMFMRKPYKRSAGEDQTKLGTTWADVEGMIKLHAFPKWAGRVLASLVIVVFVLIGFGIWNVHRTTDLVNDNHQLVQQVKAGSVANCEAGNRSRMTNKLIWDDFLNILISNPQTAKTKTALLVAIQELNLPADITQGLDTIIVANWTNNPNDVKIVQGFETYIAQHEYSVNCAKVYAN